VPRGFQVLLMVDVRKTAQGRLHRVRRLGLGLHPTCSIAYDRVQYLSHALWQQVVLGEDPIDVTVGTDSPYRIDID
jgi:hypothetical protein